MSRTRGWGDTGVVRAEEVVRVVLPFDSGEAVVALLAAVGVDQAVALVEVQHVGVYTLAEPRLQRIIRGADLGDVCGVQRGAVRMPRRAEPPVVMAVRKRCRSGADA